MSNKVLITGGAGFIGSNYVITGEIDAVNLAKTEHYATFAKRPAYSVLNCNKLKVTLGTQYINWEDSLINLIQKTRSANSLL